MRSMGPVLAAAGVTDPLELEALSVYDRGKLIVTFSPVDPDTLYDEWLAEMMADGYQLPIRADGSGVDRSQRDIDVARSMAEAGVPPEIAAQALLAGSDKAQERGEGYVHHVLAAVWGGE
jgi:hypothetical protein